MLRVLQEREFERVGGSETVKADVRLIAATNKDLKREVEAGRFREDLYYRLNVINLEMPSLRERSGDVAALALHFLGKYARENGKVIERFNDAALQRMMRYDWPGNVRELENVVERAVVLADGNSIEPGHLPAEVMPASTDPGLPVVPGARLDELERYAIEKTLESVGGSTSKAAEILGISVRKIQYKLHEYADTRKSGADAIEREMAS